MKAFNTLPRPSLAADPRCNGGRRVIFFSGDHARAKAEVGRLVERLASPASTSGPLVGRRIACSSFPVGRWRRIDLIRLG